jgi:hypothetical protein
MTPLSLHPAHAHIDNIYIYTYICIYNIYVYTYICIYAYASRLLHGGQISVVS